MEDRNALHLVLSNTDGEPLDASKKKLEPDQYLEYLEKIFQNIDDNGPTDEFGKKRILIHIHGGLNRLDASLNRARDLAPDIWKAEYYPILFGWRSGPFLSYFEHLLVIRQGRKRWWAPLTSPFVLVADLGRGLTRAPLVIWRQVMTAAKVERFGWDTDTRNARTLSAALRKKYEEQANIGESGNGQSAMTCGAIAASMGEDTRTWLKKAAKAVSYLVTFLLLFKPFLAVLIDGFGKAAWENMLRRTKVVFRTPSEFDIHKIREEPKLVDDALCSSAMGAVSGLFQALTNLVNPEGKVDPFDSNYEIVLVGHSMGVIIMNEAIRLYPNLPYRKIVYMGAACSIREFVESVVPYLMDHERARFFNLCLHPLAEAGQIPYKLIDLLPRGSLLEWIDNFFSAPHTLMDRRLGKWNNIMQATHVIPEKVRDQVTIKAFGVGKGQDKPQKHGQFNEIEFWSDHVLESS